MKTKTDEETATEAHAAGRHKSTHPEDQFFWAKVCPVCEISRSLQPWMVSMAQGHAARLTNEQLEVAANLPISGMTPGEMLDRIVAVHELVRRGAL